MNDPHFAPPARLAPSRRCKYDSVAARAGGRGGLTMTETKAGGTGGCLCGAVRYQYEGEPLRVGLCQCNRCQRQSGSAFLTGGISPTAPATLEGPLTTYEPTVHGKNP